MTNWAQIGPVGGAAFLGSLVECVEALTIVLAVGATRGWRPALTGAAAGFAVLAAAVALLGPMISGIAIGQLQVVVGILLLLFGMRWLRKAILRAAGAIALHDEAAAYAKETERMRSVTTESARAADLIAAAASFKAVVIEGLEVAFIVIALSTSSALLLPAALGAGAAAVVVALLGVAVHRPLALVPENALKFAVGVLISAFGVFWIGEGFGFAWPGADLSIVAMVGVLLLTALGAVKLLRPKHRQAKERVA
jgi:uncharacterized membrane protein